MIIIIKTLNTMPPILRKPIQCSKASDGYKRGIGIAVE